MKLTNLEKQLGITPEFLAEQEAIDKRLAQLRKDMDAVKNLKPLTDRREYCQECRKYHNPPTWPNCAVNRPASYRTINGAK